MYCEEFQNITDKFFDDFINSPECLESRQIYKKELDAVELKHPDEVKKSFGYRKDTRTFGEFGLHIYEETTYTERSCFNFWSKKFGNKHFNPFDFKSSGIDQQGRLIWGGTKKAIKTPDYYSEANDEYLEIKYSPCHFKNTFKKDDFLHYNSLGNVYVLSITCMTYTPIFQERSFSHYLLITPGEIAEICQDIKSGELQCVPCGKEYGGKSGFQFHFCESETERINKLSRGSLYPSAVYYDKYCRQLGK